MQTNLYLHALLAELVEIGIKSEPNLGENEASILKKADDLASCRAQKTAAGGSVDSIFSHLVFPNEPEKEKKYGLKKSFPQIPLTLKDDFFPGKTGGGSLIAEFQKEFDALPNFENDLARAETLLFLLQKYGTTMASGIAPDISIYDFVKSKLAFVQCLKAFSDPKNLPAEPFLLVGGDMSGIQEFLYDIVSTNASKNLKGRSYYLHLLGDTILTCLLDKLELPLANVIYASGGSFYVLAPNTEKVKNALDNFEKTVNHQLFAAHKTSLSFIIEKVEVSENVILEKKIGSAWAGLTKKFDRKKRAKFNQQFQNNFSELFEPSEAGGETLRDVVNGAEILDAPYILEDSFPKIATPDQVAAGENLISKPTAHQIMMGLFLKSTMFRMVGNENLEIDFSWKFDADRKFQPAGFPVHQFILDEDTVNLPVLKSQPTQILAVNQFDFLKKIKNSGIKGFELYGGNDFPKTNLKGSSDKIAKTFSEMAGMGDEDRMLKYDDSDLKKFDQTKFKRLSILRMDVDNLGKIFETAFQETGTLAHYSALSRQLDWFFKGYLNTLWEKGSTGIQKWSDHTQIIYSGGDDLFIVGKWDCLIDFAEKIRTEFKNWTCEHEGMGISGGIVLVTPKFPVIKAAELCAKAEKNAKKHKVSGIEKNAFSLFNYPLNWEHEWDTVKNLKDQFVDFVEAKHLPRSLMMMLAAYHELKSEQSKRDESPTWRWQIAYNLTRQKQRTKDNGAFSFIEKLTIDIFSGSKKGSSKEYEYFDLVAVAVRWAEYDLRRDD